MLLFNNQPVLQGRKKKQPGGTSSLSVDDVIVHANN